MKYLQFYKKNSEQNISKQNKSASNIAEVSENFENLYEECMNEWCKNLKIKMNIVQNYE